MLSRPFTNINLVFVFWLNLMLSHALLSQHPTDHNTEVVPMEMTKTNSQWSAYWSPDYKQITYTDWTTTKQEGANREWNWDIYVMDTNGQNVRNLTDHPSVDIDSHWSPDGQRICFSSNRDGNFDIFLMDVSGDNLQKITKGSIDKFYPRWSPDGSMIAMQMVKDGNTDIAILHLEKDSVSFLTNHQETDTDPSWSPDGNEIVFTSARDGNQEIYKINLDATGLTRLTFTSANESTPSFSNDGNFIAFGSDRDGFGMRKRWESFPQNYIMKADGSNLQRITLTKTGGNSQIGWSKDDEKILFNSWREANRGIYISNRDGTEVHRITPNYLSSFTQSVLVDGVAIALDKLNHARKDDPDNIFFTSGEIRHLAFKFIAEERFDEVDRLLGFAIEEQPNDQTYQDILITARKAAGKDAPPYPNEIIAEMKDDFARGIRNFRQLIVRYPGWYLVSRNTIIDYYQKLGQANLLMNQQALLEVFLEKNPDDEKVLELLGDLYIKLGK